jgi:hypothetical protein
MARRGGPPITLAHLIPTPLQEDGVGLILATAGRLRCGGVLRLRLRWLLSRRNVRREPEKHQAQRRHKYPPALSHRFLP